MTARHLASFGALITMAYLCVATSPVPEKPMPQAHLSIPFALGQTEAWVRVQLTGTELVFASDGKHAFSATLSTSADPLLSCDVPNYGEGEGFCFDNPAGGDAELLVKIELLGVSRETTLDLTVYVSGETVRTGTAWVGDADLFAYGVTLELL